MKIARDGVTPLRRNASSPARATNLFALLGAFAGFVPSGSSTHASSTPPGTFVNPVVRDGADPYVIYKNGSYYFLSTRSTTIQIGKASSLAGLARAKPRTVWTPPRKGPNSSQIWAPELHFLRGKWYLYYTATTEDGSDGNRRTWALEATTSDPLGPYRDRGKVFDPRHDEYAIDGTVFERPSGGALFFLWSGRPPGGAQSIFIAPMKDPWTISGPRVRLSAPEHGWEKIGWPVNEGPAVLHRDGKTFVVYSANGGTTPDYCLGLLVNTDGNLLNPGSWTKSARPIFHQYAGPDGVVFTPGHNGFFRSPDGTEDWMIYHGKEKADRTWGGRDARAQRFSWDSAGAPNLGHPIPAGVPLAVPSGEAGGGRLPSGSGTGLRAEYYDSVDFTGPATTRVDRTIDFDWLLGAPLAGMGPDSFSVRWRGKIEPRFSETYTFKTYSDDGVRVWIDGRLVIEDWANHFGTAKQGTIQLKKGPRYDIVVEYYEWDIEARVTLEWRSPNQPFEVVPESQLYPE